MTVIRLDESEIKALVLSQLREEKTVNPGDVVASEFAIDGMMRRVDLALLSREFIGIEIKSDFDNLRRLASQLEAYLRYFDRVILVAAERHIKKALEIAPAAVSVWSISAAGSLSAIREAYVTIDLLPKNLVRLLSSEDLRRLVASSRQKTLSRRELTALAAEKLSPSEVREAVRSAFRSRYGETSRVFWRAVSERPVQSRHLSELSRFVKKRQQAEEIRVRNEAFWRDWEMAAQLYFQRQGTAVGNAASIGNGGLQAYKSSRTSPHPCRTAPDRHRKKVAGAGEC